MSVRERVLLMVLLPGASFMVACAATSRSVGAPIVSTLERPADMIDGSPVWLELATPRQFVRDDRARDCYRTEDESVRFCLRVVDSAAASREWFQADSTQLPPACFDCVFYEPLSRDTIEIAPRIIARQRALMTGSLAHLRRAPVAMLQVSLRPDLVAVISASGRSSGAAERDLVAVARSLRLRR